MTQPSASASSCLHAAACMYIPHAIAEGQATKVTAYRTSETSTVPCVCHEAVTCTATHMKHVEATCPICRMVLLHAQQSSTGERKSSQVALGVLIRTSCNIVLYVHMIDYHIPDLTCNNTKNTHTTVSMCLPAELAVLNSVCGCPTMFTHTVGVQDRCSSCCI